MSDNIRHPFEWSSVVIWAFTLFLWGLTTARPMYGSVIDRPALGLMMGFVLAVIGGVIVAIIKYFRRSPKPDSIAALASAKANDKAIFFGALVISVFLVCKAIYFETYGALIDAVILIALGFGVKNGLVVARWLLVAYAFISPIIVVAIGSGNAIIWPIIFYVTCRSIKAHGYVDMADEMVNKRIPISASNTTPQQPISTSLASVQKTPLVGQVTIGTQGASIDTKELAVNHQQPVNAAHFIAIESSQQSMQEIEDRLYEQIAQEIETNTVDKGIWTKAFSQTGGDDKQTRVLYIKARFDRLMAAENARLEAMQREKEEIARREQEQRARDREEVERFELLRKRINVAESAGLDDVKKLARSVEAFDFLNWCCWNDVDKVKEAVEKNPLLLAITNSGGNTALHLAVIAKQLEVVKYLVGRGASVSERNNDGNTPLDIAKRKDLPELVELLQQA